MKTKNPFYNLWGAAILNIQWANDTHLTFHCTRAEHITNELTLNFLLQLVLPFFFLVIRENTANRIGENTKSKRQQKTNSAFHLFHSVFMKSRPYHLRLIPVSTTAWVKNCRRNVGRNQVILNQCDLVKRCHFLYKPCVPVS